MHKTLHESPVRLAGLFKEASGVRVKIRTGTRVPEWHDVLLTDKTVDANSIDKLLANGYTDPGKVFGGVTISKKALRKKINKRIKSKKKA